MRGLPRLIHKWKTGNGIAIHTSLPEARGFAHLEHEENLNEDELNSEDHLRNYKTCNNEQKEQDFASNS